MEKLLLNNIYEKAYELYPVGYTEIGDEDLNMPKREAFIEGILYASKHPELIADNVRVIGVNKMISKSDLDSAINKDIYLGVIKSAMQGEIIECLKLYIKTEEEKTDYGNLNLKSTIRVIKQTE